ncbi:hypothetical protein V2G26_004827 [Clonostachys chloroleuca]
MAFECGSCDRLFWAGWKARDQHCSATGHRHPDFECDTCYFIFDNEQTRRRHMDISRHWNDAAVPCNACNSFLPTEQEAKQHEADVHVRCRPCDRDFMNRNNLVQHLNSSIHRQTKVTCPFCKSQHGTATGLVHHLERGSCPRAPLDRDSLYRAVRQYDPNGVVSKKLLEWNGSSSYSANERAWNPYAEAFECYLCSRLFNTLNGLNQHLNSPVHQQALYHCPNPSCRRDFTTLAATINHLESESCGFMKFRAVQTNVERIINPNRMLQF